MENIKIKHFNGLQTDWERRVAEGDFVNDIVFAKAWTQDASTQAWSKKLLIYAGQDQYNQEYTYEIPDFSTFIAIEKLIDISNGGFTSQAFRNSLENYIIESDKIISIDSSISEIDQEITELADKIVDVDTSIRAITNNINGINSSIENINSSIDSINVSILYIEQSIDWNDED